MKITVNAGHCPGFDNGAVGDRITEAEVNQKVMEMVTEGLRQAGHEVLSIQQNDIRQIVRKSNAFGGDLFVSLHCNASVDHAAAGTEVHYYGEEGKKLAVCVQRCIVSSLATVDRGCRRSENLYALRYTVCPAVVVEMAFITNREDEELLMYGAEEFANAITRGIEKYFFRLV